MRIILDLSQEEIEKLTEQLDAWDVGPPHAGWKSETLMELERKVADAIQIAV